MPGSPFDIPFLLLGNRLLAGSLVAAVCAEQVNLFRLPAPSLSRLRSGPCRFWLTEQASLQIRLKSIKDPCRKRSVRVLAHLICILATDSDRAPDCVQKERTVGGGRVVLRGGVEIVRPVAVCGKDLVETLSFTLRNQSHVSQPLSICSVQFSQLPSGSSVPSRSTPAAAIPAEPTPGRSPEGPGLPTRARRFSWRGAEGPAPPRA